MQLFLKVRAWAHAYLVMERISEGWAPLPQKRLRMLLHPLWGLGATYLVLIEPPTQPHADFLVRLYNAKGERCDSSGIAAFVAAYSIQRWGYTIHPHRPIRLELEGQSQLGLLEPIKGHLFRWLSPPELAPPPSPLLEAVFEGAKGTRLRCWSSRLCEVGGGEEGSRPLTWAVLEGPEWSLRDLLKSAEQRLGFHPELLLHQKPSSGRESETHALTVLSPDLPAWTQLLHHLPALQSALGASKVSLEGGRGAKLLRNLAETTQEASWALEVQPLLHGKVKA